MTFRWPLVASLAALIAGAGLAALVLAFCGGGEDGSDSVRTPTRTPSSRTVTVTRSPGTGTPVTTGTPTGTPSALTPSAETATPSIGPPPDDTPEGPTPPPPDETAPPGPTQTPRPGETAPPASPTPPRGTPTPVPPTSTPTHTPTPTPPPVLPDLRILDVFVSNNRLGVILGNQGEGPLLAGQDLEFRVRGVMAEPVTLSQALLPGRSLSLVFEDQVIYQSEMVLAIVDPDNVIPEEDDNNNGIAKLLAPDVGLDLAVHNVFGANAHGLRVVLQNRSDSPLLQAEVVITVYLGDSPDPTTVSPPQVLSIEPRGFETVEVIGVSPLPGWQVRVVATMTTLPDVNPANNEWSGTVS